MILLCTSFVSVSKHVNAKTVFVNVLMSTIAWTRIHSFCCFGFEVPVHEDHFFRFFKHIEIAAIHVLASRFTNFKQKTKNQRFQTEKKTHTIPSHLEIHFCSDFFFVPEKSLIFATAVATSKQLRPPIRSRNGKLS